MTDITETDITERLEALDDELFHAITYVDGDDCAGSILAGKVRSAMCEARAEIRRLRAESEWRPIETAPRDGTHVLVLLGNGEMFRASWVAPENCWVAASDIGWVNPTHWRPLPQPPEAE